MAEHESPIVYEWEDAPSASFAVLGDPIAHSWSPQIHTAAMRAAGIEDDYLRIRVKQGDFLAASNRLREMGYRGVNVTLPLKHEAAAVYGQENSINTIDFRDKTGVSTDQQGLVRALKSLESGLRVLVLGTGGTAAAIIPALVAAGYEVSVWGRDPLKAHNLGVPVLRTADTQEMDTVINATSSSLLREELPVMFRGTGLAMDCAYAFKPTPFMVQAIQAGWRAADGREMLIQQAALSFEIWHGFFPDLTVMRGALPR